MLARFDKALALLGWVAAAVLVVMLFVGPQVIAEDEAKPTQEGAAGSAPYSGGGAAADGKAVFSDRCGSCHTLSSAGTTGQVGPNLDGSQLETAEVEEIVRGGRGGMPAFEGDLSDAEIKAVAELVAPSP